jgi:DNA-directed RNA polymerase specialized sigma24 family protein
MSGDEVRLHAMAQALARIARAAALHLPREVVDDAAQDAWARWLDACGGEDRGASPAEPLAFLVGCFHHACADAVRAHRRRQRLHVLAADAGGESIDVADATGARASGGEGASNRSSTRSCGRRSPDCLRPTSSCGSPPRSTASVGARRARQPGWTRRRSADRGKEF